jgi:hypothetical protein
MIKDGKGHKWSVRFKEYQNEWYWRARCDGYGFEAARMLETKALAETDARQVLQSHDALAQAQEFSRRRRMRGSPCQLTDEDREAIRAAGRL